MDPKGAIDLAWLKDELANIRFVKHFILKGAMNLAWLKDHVKTMAELAKYTEPDEEVKSSNVWELVEKEQNRR